MAEQTDALSAEDSAARAFQALLGLARQCRKSARGLPAQVDIKPHWSGIGFELLGRRFVAPMGEVTEMLEVPPYTRLPGVQPWVKGVSNVRGRLLPVCDLAAFFGERLTTGRKLQRILILENDELYTGLMVDRVFGMQHFPVDTYSDQVSSEHPASAFSRGCYRQDDVEWIVFSPALLSQDGQFLNAASA
ncbi:chemotaxis protein CheW [Pseudomaricurvus alkylphenolicus]|uniref:chemotaxis protein CheW n=1 Tax=Pseudomaricurvus alkylphenolicus TaxID=1306991 RepID=UPI001423BEBA|nr:chemotaxis protein CheW [Pseudomaricurvus alkylphenolicus]NIB39614.1 chemotaxis protein CheW [Pseudomaricurvus alkylphenolicus]